MMQSYTYRTIEAPANSEFKDRGSKFIGYSLLVDSIDQCKLKLKAIKELHPKATHHCFAYRLGIDNNNFRASDDGEPSASAGKPILGAIDSMQVTNTMVVVVRYYGGTMLGVPGLINAYKTTANLALDLSEIIVQEQTKSAELEFDYNLTSIVNQTITKLNAVDMQTANLLFCKKTVKIPMSKVDQAQEVFNKIHNLAFKWIN